jgi:polyisoprenyl-phosphate glycosyltransferase
MKLSIVVPVFNEELNLNLLHERLARVAGHAADDYEIIFVNDGSADGSLAAISRLCEQDPHVRYVSLSRNFGHQIASTAGLDRATGDAVVLIDADLQDPPEVIAEMVDRWRRGAAVVYGRRRARLGESAFKKWTAHLFYRMLSRISDVNIPLDTGDFRLMDRRVVDVLRTCRENPRFLRGLVAWIGFKQEAAEYERAGRHAGQSNYTIGKMIHLAWAGACAFSLVPLQLASWCGGLMLLSGLILAMVLGVRAIFSHQTTSGQTLLACGILLMLLIAGVQLLILGVVARYIGCILQSVQDRPLYVVESQGGWDRSGNDGSSTAARTGTEI